MPVALCAHSSAAATQTVVHMGRQHHSQPGNWLSWVVRDQIPPTSEAPAGAMITCSSQFPSSAQPPRKTPERSPASRAHAHVRHRPAALPRRSPHSPPTPADSARNTPWPSRTNSSTSSRSSRSSTTRSTRSRRRRRRPCPRPRRQRNSSGRSSSAPLVQVRPLYPHVARRGG